MKTINSFRSKLFALALALMASVSSFAYEFVFVNDFHIDGFAYKIIDRNEPCAVALIEVADCEKHVAIPESVAYNDTTFVVTTLGMGDIVFTGIAQKTMESLYIPKTIMIVNYHALGGCPNLMSIVVDEENKYLDSRNNCNAIISSDDTYRPANHLVAGCKTTVIPNSVTEIGNYAFVRCETLENIIIPEGVTTINDGAFYECSSLSSIKLPESLIKLSQEWIFSGCTSLKEVFFFAKTPPCIAYGMFHGINPTIYVPKESLDAYENVLCWRYFDIQAIPDSMYFADDHFVQDSIHYHILNDTIAPFEVEVTYTFGSLSNMTQKNYPELTEVNIPAFVEYKGHTYIVTRIGELAFNCAQKLQRVTMGENIKTIDRFAIMNCPQLKEVQIGENVDSILLDAFGFGKLQQLSIPKNVKYIAPLIVRKNPITSINVHPENSNYTSIDGVLFNKKENVLHTFPAAYATEYTIPESVDTIGSCAFAGTSIESVIFPKNLVCIANEAFTGTNLTELILPASLQSIGMTAFDMCSGITEVTCRATTPPIMSDGQEEYNTSVFLRVPIANATLYVPIESVKAYKSANQWKDFGQILPITWSEECEEYKHVNMSVVVFGNSIIFDLSNNHTIEPPYVDSVWIVNTEQEPVRKLYAQSGDTIDVSFLEERGRYILNVYIDGCRKSSTFVYRPIQNKWKDIWCDTWNVMWFDGWRFDETASTSQYRLGKDTVIGDYTYSKFTSRTSVRFTDDRKVYVYYEGFDDNDPYTVDLPTGEYLAYDFSAQVGDTLEVFSGVHSYSKYKCLVHEVQTDPETKLRTITLFQLLLEDTDGDGVEEEYGRGEMTWIEGVGSPNGFLINTPPPGGGTFALLCAYKDDELKYTGDLYDEYGCEYNATEQKPEDLFPTLWGLQRTSFTEYSECSDSYASLFQSKGETITINHNQYLKFGGHYLREENKQVLLYSRLQNKDLVLYDYSLEVGDTLTTLNIDYRIEGIPFDLCYVDYAYEEVGMSHSIDTLIVTDISYVTLLDGKEHKQWTFDNGMQYVEGIGNFGQSRWSGDFFGLVEEPAIPTCLMGTHLVCVSKNNKLLYQMDDTEMERLGAECLCEYDRGPRKDNAKDGQIGGRPTPTQWNQLELDLRKMENGNTILYAETFSYTLENDSVVANGKTFYQLARQSTKDTATTKSFVGALHFGKDEDNRVYFLRDGVEYVLYDFTAEPGDTVEIFAGINNYPQDSTYTHVVVDKDTTEDGACRMFLQVVFPEGTIMAENVEKVWLAGLGSIDGIVHNTATRTSNAHAAPARSAHSSDTQTSVMLCAWRDDNCLYTTDHPDYDTLGCVYNIDEMTAIEDIHTFPSYQKLLRDGQLFIIHEGKTYNVMGIAVE